MTEETIKWEDLAGPVEKQKPATEEQFIYQLIETVDLIETSMLDEIDARVWCYLKQYHFDFIEHTPDAGVLIHYKHNPLHIHAGAFTPLLTVPQFTRSLDAIDKILPKNVCTALHFQMTSWENGETNFIILDGFHTFLSPILPNENLAKLHAAVQYHAYKKRTGGLK